MVSMASSPPESEPLSAVRAALEAGDIHHAGALAAAAWQAPGDDAFRAEAGFLLCTTHNRKGEWAALLDAAPAVLAINEGQGQVGRRVEVLRWATLAACELARFDIALQSAGESCRLAETAGDRAQWALSLVAMGCCIERMGDPWQAHRLMEEARQVVLGVDEPYTHCVILNNLCAAYIGAFYLLRDTAGADEVQGVLRAAERAAREALPLVRRVPLNGFMSAIIEGNLAEALVHLGELEEAGGLLAEALRRVTEQGNNARSWRIRYARSELLLAQGEPARAAVELETLWHELEGSQQTNTLTRVHEALYRAWRAQGDAARALAHLERFGALERARVVVQLKAQSRLFVTRIESERARLEAQAERLRAAEFEADALRDQLTGLGNRRALERRMAVLVDSAAASGAALTVALVDLDHFKRVNDRFGHAIGDRVLVRMAQLLREHSRSTDVLVRLGGEEFIIVFADTPLALAAEICERLRDQVERHDWTTIAPGLALTLSIGLASTPPHEPAGLIDGADAAMYRAKEAGRNRVAVQAV